MLFKERTANPDGTNVNLANSGNGTSDYKIRSQDILQIRNLQNIKYIVDESPVSTTSNTNNNIITTQGQTYHVPDDNTRMLFTLGNKVVHEEDFVSLDYHNSIIDFSMAGDSIHKGRPYYLTPTQAIFKVEKAKDKDACKNCYIYSFALIKSK